MKITPLDIQQQQFRVKFRGFDMVEVDNFLDLVANEWEELLRENNQLKEEDHQKAERIEELKGAERELRNALVSAQQICEEIKNNARKEGDLIIEEAKGNARKIIEAAQAQAIQLQTDISQLHRQREEFKASLKSTVDMHLRLLESYREGLSSPAPEKGE
ncbi:MAG TPA: DivIVA domain-containing protein [Thermodesulfobacteriota bacterium]|nr:DivIVA domain-containing protein [Thermodesulfobacteriota bacterium]